MLYAYEDDKPISRADGVVLQIRDQRLTDVGYALSALRLAVEAAEGVGDRTRAFGDNAVHFLIFQTITKTNIHESFTSITG